ncbi:snf7 domain-containing protein [Ditylenchus destructor]|uniref:Snf7 domain-containing protein n=1 Tax=Ditylenchus destructor TaxID=166010 RepID=A0AAD4R714_9BILA|nr:snf7 domain-containing protein [Ditylenchus destructor]
MGSIFSKKHGNSPKYEATEQEKAILALKMQRDNMKQAFKRYENNIVKEKNMARNLLNDGRKDRALVVLKRKKYQEQLMDRILLQLDQIERMVHEIEAAQLNKEVYEKLRLGNQALKKLSEEFSIDEVEKLMEETREAAELQEELSSILATKLTQDDLDKVDEEYDEMIREQLPSVPTDELPQRAKEKEPEKKKERKAQKIALEAT